MSSAVSIEGLVKTFGTHRALDGLDLEIAAGKVCALLGPNGAGKSTAVRALATLSIPDEGQIRVHGRDAQTESGAVRAQIGLAGQSAAVDDDLTGRENLRILGMMQHLGRRRARERADELLREYELEEAGDRLVSTYSGGMRRRLDLIASFVLPRAVLLLDEPTTGLDPRSRNEIWATVRRLVATGTTVLLTTQYLEEADQLADEVVIIDRGRRVASGPPEELKRRIGVRVDIDLQEAEQLPLAAAALGELTGSTAEVNAGAQRVSAPSSREVTIPEVVRHLDAAGVVLTDAELRKPSLDEVFLSITGKPRMQEAS
ncbi:ATP-binding cassette domain-containing protein [Cumulibacter soli]|uniref:ATP-binding cassette domain-containing protein n=1 Tax=Cumulibacter soli TaxID=2546344 RepID=UPI0010676E75|nr:ATP-binding cassette domain-containing protein [Cumulibacter soli]